MENTQHFLELMIKKTLGLSANAPDVVAGKEIIANNCF